MYWWTVVVEIARDPRILLHSPLSLRNWRVLLGRRGRWIDAVRFFFFLSFCVFLPLSRSPSAVSSRTLREQNRAFSLGNDQPLRTRGMISHTVYDLAKDRIFQDFNFNVHYRSGSKSIKDYCRYCLALHWLRSTWCYTERMVLLMKYLDIWLDIDLKSNFVGPSK